MSHELCYLDAREALNLFRQHRLSPVELMQATIDRIEAVNPAINAFTDTYFEQALQQAKKSEQRYMSGNPRRLEGLPLAVKDEFRLKGTRRTSSSLVHEHLVDEETDVLIDRLLRAGAICHGKTTTPEFCLLGSCHSRLWGVTRNPFNLDITPGGSSGGSGAALAAGMATLATGTDIGGSIRIPASLCGLAGYKPPYGRNPEIPVFNLDFYSHSGPMARSSVDAALMQNVVSGPHNRDIASLRSRVRLDTENEPTDLKGWKIAWSMDLGFFEVDAEVRNNTLASLDTFRELGAEVTEVQLDWNEEIIDAVYHYWAHMWAGSMTGLLEENRDLLNDYTIYFLERSGRSTLPDFNRSLEVAVEMYDTFGPLMDRFHLFVCPTLTTSGIPADFTWPASAVEMNGRTLDLDEERWSMTFPFNMLSRCPALSIPNGYASNNVPTGIQLVARTYDDRRVFEAARAFEAAQTGFSGYHLDTRI